MAEASGAAKGVGVLEVGPGIGVLTAELAKRAERVVSVELDKRLLPVLEETLGEFPHVKIIQGDILKLDLHRLLQEEFQGLEVVVCANLPYYITSPVIMRFLEEKLPLSALTVMVQKEAAERLCALPGTRACGAVSAAVRYYAEPEILLSLIHIWFISGNHLTAEHGFTTPSVQEAKLKRMIMQNCKESYVLLDHTKFGDDSLSLIAPTAELDGLITDWHTPESVLLPLREQGVRILQGCGENA